MEYQQLPPVSMIIGSPNTTSLIHSNNNNNNNNNGTNNQLLTMQPPLLPLQVAHNLHQLTSLNNTNNNNQNNGILIGSSNQSSQSLPPTTQLLQALHNNNNNNNTQHQTNIQNIGNNTNGTTNNPNDNNGSNEDNSRWTQYQVQQLWRQHHAYLNGKTNNKDICGDDKHKEDGDPWNVEAQAAFLGPNLWDKTLPYDTDLKVHQYADLDEFLSENGIPVDGLPSSHLGHSTNIGGGGTNNRNDNLGHGLSLGLGPVTKRERSPSPSDCMSPDSMNNPPSPADSTFSMSSTRDFDPRTRAFSDEELKPSPMIKKSRKQFVPDEMKDDKYWARRRKNNMAAKRSRDARRMKENQIALRAGFLEKENMNLHREVEQLKQENMELRSRLSKYQEV